MVVRGAGAEARAAPPDYWRRRWLVAAADEQAEAANEHVQRQAGVPRLSPANQGVRMILKSDGGTEAMYV